MNVCLICEASLSHHTLYTGNLVPVYTMYHIFPCWPPKKRNGTDFEADQGPETGGVLGYFLALYVYFYFLGYAYSRRRGKGIER